MDKRLSYSQRILVESYDRRRFSGRSGAFVNRIELDMVCSLLGRYSLQDKIILDVPCGTGRFSKFLKDRGIEVIALDYSEAMIKQTLEKVNIPIVRGDIFSLPIKNSSIDCIVSLRFMFHYESIGDVLHELSRILCDGGIFIFDTFNWSPKANFIFGDKRVFIHTHKKISSLIKEIGLSLIDERHSFLVSPQIYKMLPFRLTKFMRNLEKLFPSCLLARSFWCAKKNG